MHLAIGTREEAGYRERAVERAVELARHFVQGRDPGRAVRYLVQAGQNALRLSAHVEALRRFNMGLTLLADLPETMERRQQQELWLHTGVVIAQSTLKGVSPEIERILLRAHALCQHIGETPTRIPVLTGLWAFYFATGKQRTARQLAEQAFRLAHDARETALLGVARANLRATLFNVSIPHSAFRSRSIFSESDRHCTAVAGQGVRAASDYEPCPAVATTGSATRGAHHVSRGLSLVHGRV
jgi:hypothetical protein